MTLFPALTALLGGIGLFLLGMWLMTDGLKLAAGNALRDILASWTNTRGRALGTGFMITGLVQSSSAVTVATIGFANAGLLTLEEAVWVIFGSNVGTTMTGWIVALLGFKLNIEAFALPLIGAGMILRLAGGKGRMAALGQAVVGFGLFFLGISVLKDGFAGQLGDFVLPGIRSDGWQVLPVYLLIGIFLTTLMQSSSAAMVITLGAAETGLIPLAAAGAVVIGTNLGTTTTAIISVWGATPTAKRVAASHVLFNLFTAAAAIIILLPTLDLIALVQARTDLADTPAMTLAMYHTAFNLLGVLIMWPLSRYLVAVLKRRFIAAAELAGRPAYLDATSLEIPDVAAGALFKELERTGALAFQAARRHLSRDQPPGAAAEASGVEALVNAIGDFVGKLGKKDLPAPVADALPVVIRVAQQFLGIEDDAREVAQLQEKLRIGDQALLDASRGYREQALQLLDAVSAGLDEAADARAAARLATLEQAYDSLKLHILKAGSDGTIGMVTVDALLRQIDNIRRIAEQSLKAARRLTGLQALTGSRVRTQQAIQPL